jgi:hypothetical protein
MTLRKYDGIFDETLDQALDRVKILIIFNHTHRDIGRQERIMI